MKLLVAAEVCRWKIDSLYLDFLNKHIDSSRKSVRWPLLDLLHLLYT